MVWIKDPKFERTGDIAEQELDLMVQDEYFVAEIGWMGHGLQMWLQTIWFLTRCSQSSTVVLDEPDVYMHADLQRKLIRYLKEHFSQVIVATHSIEIMSEVDADNILIIDKAKSKSLYATGKPSVQRIVNSIGSIHNIQLARLWASKKLLIVEGKDIEILKRIQNVLLGQSNMPLDSIPNFSIGGWGGWSYAIGSKLLLKNAVDESLLTYCIFDSDYHTDEEKARRKDEAIEYGVSLHIWSKKEIENYLLNAEVISRLVDIDRRTDNIISKQMVQEKIASIADEMKDDVTDAIANELQQKNRKINAGTAHKQAREMIKKANCIIDVASGKEIISKLSLWSQTNYGVSFSANKLASNFTIKDVDREMKEVILRICK